MSDVAQIEATDSLSGSLTVPGDKSISHRSLLLSALAEGRSEIEGLSTGDDVRRTGQVVVALGADLRAEGGVTIVHGGRERLRSAGAPLDFGNSGTGLRLALGLVSTIDGRHELIGDSSLSTRPMDRVAEPLERMGAVVDGVGGRRTPPVHVTGGQLSGIDYQVPVPSAQVKSAILIAGLAASGTTIVREALRTRPNTEDMIAAAGGAIAIEDEGRGRTISLKASEITPRRWVVPGDPSQAAFFVVAGLLVRSGAISVEQVYADETRTGFLDVLERMGGRIERRLDAEGLLSITALPSPLHATEVHAEEIPSVDEVPILVVAAAAAEGTTRFVDVGELRIKESDRFERSLRLAEGLGARCHGEDDDLVIEGLGSPLRFERLEFEAMEDHRMAMSTAIAGAVGNGAVVSGFETVSSSFPGFLGLLGGLR